MTETRKDENEKKNEDTLRRIRDRKQNYHDRDEKKDWE